MDGFTGFKTAAVEAMPDTVPVMDPFHVVRLAGDALDQCRRRIQQNLHGHRGRRGDPLYKARRTLHTGADLLTDRQWSRLTALFAIEAHIPVEVTWCVYQRMVAAYRHPDRRRGRELMAQLIASLRNVPAALVELAVLGRTLTKRAADVLAYFDRPGTSNGADRGDQRPSRAPTGIRSRVPEPHQLHRPITARSRRVQTPTTPSIVKSHSCS